MPQHWAFVRRLRVGLEPVIWGGGSTISGPVSATFHGRAVISCIVDPEEHHYLEWFRCRTSVKLPGLFASPYWRTLVFQASVTEPAVRHAAVALSAVHKTGVSPGERLGARDRTPSPNERLMLQHYNKAISALQDHSKIKDRSSTRVVLVTCVLFVCLELLQGHCQTAREHLRSGVAVITAYNTAKHRPFDDEIAAELSALHSRIALLYPADPGIEDDAQMLPTSIPCSVNQFKASLDSLLSRACGLAAQYHRREVIGTSSSHCEVEHKQPALVDELFCWLQSYKALRDCLTTNVSLYDKLGDCLLRSHHAMATIMAARSSEDPGGDTSSCTTEFISILAHSIPLSVLRRSSQFEIMHNRLYGSPMPDSTNNVVDMGWIPPLFFTATKCRVPHIRFQAIRLLERSPHCEGAWVATTIAAIARKIMQMEDPISYDRLHKDVDFAWEALPVAEECESGVLEEGRMIHELQVILPDDPLGAVVVRCERRKTSGEWECVEITYDVVDGCWIDEKLVALPQAAEGC
ncbi:hypothetical protein LTR56_018801 [Elasticomyces elasticus]|nr:hypothetical protein LTR22_024564 [Elasticomyces elasticus]KAK3628064.1 hypothetical protein LTR56_018801 [Elasticomyces elasticus]KAK4907060.1 hypothetical protein LTR49_023913 [Elasticomyces elasticus]KAK5742737.1 hypothetical protein LTS12_024104 [Elasticomyces elasticus]